MAGYKPAAPFATPMYILNPTYQTVKGVPKETWPDIKTLGEDDLIFSTFRTFGGTDVFSNDLYTVQSTGTVETWYRPDLKSNTRLYIVGTQETYEILGDPEDIEMRHQYLKIRVRKIGGGA